MRIVEQPGESKIPNDIDIARSWVANLYDLDYLPEGYSKKSARNKISLIFFMLSAITSTMLFPILSVEFFAVLVLGLITPSLMFNFTSGLHIVGKRSNFQTFFYYMVLMVGVSSLVIFINNLNNKFFLLGEFLLVILIFSSFFKIGSRNEMNFCNVGSSFKEQAVTDYLNVKFNWVDDYVINKYRAGPMKDFEYRNLTGTRRELTKNDYTFDKAWNSLVDTDIYSLKEKSLWKKIKWVFRSTSAD